MRSDQIAQMTTVAAVAYQRAVRETLKLHSLSLLTCNYVRRNSKQLGDGGVEAKAEALMSTADTEGYRYVPVDNGSVPKISGTIICGHNNPGRLTVGRTQYQTLQEVPCS